MYRFYNDIEEDFLYVINSGYIIGRGDKGAQGDIESFGAGNGDLKCARVNINIDVDVAANRFIAGLIDCWETAAKGGEATKIGDKNAN